VGGESVCTSVSAKVLIYRPKDLKDVMLANEAFVSTIKKLIHHLVHVWQLVNLTINAHVLEAKEAISNKL
jgi:hypothetical protein